jgi:PAS domain S-box-containing protein
MNFKTHTKIYATKEIPGNCVSSKITCSALKQGQIKYTNYFENINKVIFDSIDNPIIFLDNNLDIVFLNRATEAFLCTSSDDLIGINIRNNCAQNVHSPLCTVLLKSIYSKLNITRNFNTTEKWTKYFYREETSSKEYYKIKATPVFHDSILIGFLITITDISQRVTSKLRLRISKLLNKGILDISRDAIFTFDSTMSIIDMNSSARRLFISPSDDYKCNNLEDVIHIKKPNSSSQLISDALAKQKLNEYLEINAIDKSGKEYNFEVSVSVIKCLDDTFYIAVFHDLISREQGENQLHLQLSQANKQNEAKSTFLAVMSHEIRTPLIGVLGAHEILQDTDLNEEQTRYLEIATTSSRTLLALINGILDFSKIEAGKLELDLQPFNPEDTINQVVEILAAMAYKKGISIQTYIDPNLPTQIVSDPVRLHQVLVNLVNNAIKFTDNGGVSVAALRSKRDPNLLVFEVNDTGIGIPSDKINTIFDDFTQVETSTHRRYGGTGLGLAISNRLVNLLGGELKLSSKPGVGSKFWFTLQLPESAASHVYKVPSGLNGVKLLLVDNSLMSSSILIRQLQSFSLAVTHVSTLNEALHRLASLDNYGAYYQIVIVNLFKLDGNLNHFCKSLEQLPDNNKCCFILIGPSGSIRQTKSYHESVFSSAIPLPIRRTTLIQRIELLLDKGIDNYKPGDQAIVNAPQCQKNTSILIVDDVSTNRIVTESMLVRAGYFTYTAENGEEAISVIQQNKIDLVLMDLSMPIMDGIEATIYIRTLPNFKTLPIVALSATVLQEEIDACSHAGMNDFLGKPFTKQVLLSKMTEWTSIATIDSNADDALTSSGNTKTIETVDKNQLADDSKYIDSEVLSGMLEDLPAEKYIEVINLFVSESAKRLEKINQLLTSKDIVELGNQTHALKGSAATFGATLLTPLAENLELCCKQGKAEETEELVKQVIEVGRRTLEAYQNNFTCRNTLRL